jgi:hypothetical protein
MSSKTHVVYTDGSCLNNGTARASAGIGVFFGLNSRRNISRKLVADKISNNVAEIRAILVVQQPCSGRRIRLRDRRQVRVDSERLEFENRTKGGVLGRAMDGFRYGYLMLSRMDVAISYSPSINLDEATGNYLDHADFHHNPVVGKNNNT